MTPDAPLSYQWDSIVQSTPCKQSINQNSSWIISILWNTSVTTSPSFTVEPSAIISCRRWTCNAERALQKRSSEPLSFSGSMAEIETRQLQWPERRFDRIISRRQRQSDWRLTAQFPLHWCNRIATVHGGSSPRSIVIHWNASENDTAVLQQRHVTN